MVCSCLSRLTRVSSHAFSRVVASSNDGGWEIEIEDIYMRNAVRTCDGGKRFVLS